MAALGAPATALPQQQQIEEGRGGEDIPLIEVRGNPSGQEYVFLFYFFYVF